MLADPSQTSKQKQLSCQQTAFELGIVGQTLHERGVNEISRPLTKEGMWPVTLIVCSHQMLICYFHDSCINSKKMKSEPAGLLISCITTWLWFEGLYHACRSGQRQCYKPGRHGCC